MYRVPKGIIIENQDKSKLIIRADKRELVFADYFEILFVFFGLYILIFGLFAKNITIYINDYYTFAVIFAGVLIIVLINILLTFKEKTIITITENFIEIIKKTIIFSETRILDKKLINSIDYKVINYTTNDNSLTYGFNISLTFRIICSLGYFKIPRILYQGENVIIFQNYNKEIKMWIIDFLNEMIKNKLNI